MDNSENSKSPESSENKNDNFDLDIGTDRPVLWGSFCFILGLLGLAFSIFSGYYDFENSIPLFGTVIAGILIGAISILIIIYGYRVMRKDL